VKELQVALNGKEEVVEAQMSLLNFLLGKGLNPETIIVEHNEKIVKKDEWCSVFLQDKDRLEVLNFVGGG